MGSSFWTPSKAQTTVADSTIELLKQEKFAKLIESAEQAGMVRVIVGVRTNFNTNDDLNAQNIEIRKEDIKKAQDKFTNQLSAYNLNPLKYKYIPYLAMSVNAEALREMENLPDVVSIEKDEMLEPLLSESVPMIGAPATWNSGYSANGQTIAVIDSGVDKTHPMFQNKIVSEACYSAYDNSIIFATCNGNYGTNPTPGDPAFIVNSTAINSGIPCNPNGNSSIISGCAHGTHVAGIAAGRTTNISGVARDATIIAINASSFIKEVTTYKLNYFNSALLLALERVFELRNNFNIASVNMSIGGGRYSANCDSEYPSIKNAIDNLRSAGIATVIASGNESYADAIGFPACISSAISVGAVADGSINQDGKPTQFDKVPAFSNSASFLNILAPGESITSSVPSFASQTGYKTLDGTSMAAPHVAGAWAVLKQRNPNASVTQILNTLTNTGIPILDTGNNITKPRIRIDRALSILGPTCVINQTSIGQTINGQSLNVSDCSFSNNLNRYYDYYTFNGTAGQQIVISMNSTAIDSYLFLIAPNNQYIAEDNDSGGNRNSRIPTTGSFFTLPATGSYTILASSYNANEIGAYTLALTSNCTFSLNQTNLSFPAVGGNGSTNVTTQSGCNWTAASNASWITVTSGASGSGSGTVGFTAAANTTAATRTGTMTIAGQTFTITQAGQSCSYTINLTNQSFNYVGGSGNFGVSTNSGCAWQAVSNANWITANNNGTGNGNVGFSVAANSSSSSRVGTISLAGNTFTVNQAGQTSNNNRNNFDFDGDGKADVSVFRPSNGTWYLQQSQNGFTGAQFGISSDKIVPADYDGDGKTDLAVYRGGTWYLNRSQSGFTGFAFGDANDIPQPADFDGDGKAELAVFRPSNGTWYVYNLANNQFNAAQFGAGTDKPVVGDYDGDGKADFAVFRPSNGTWYLQRSRDGFTGIQFGDVSDKPVAADYDGDGKTDVAVFRPSNGTWYLQRSQLGFTGIQFGIATDLPVAADYDGDGKADVAVYRSGVWYLNRTTAGFTGVQFGAATDKPVPNASVP